MAHRGWQSDEYYVLRCGLEHSPDRGLLKASLLSCIFNNGMTVGDACVAKADMAGERARRTSVQAMLTKCSQQLHPTFMESYSFYTMACSYLQSGREGQYLQ